MSITMNKTWQKRTGSSLHERSGGGATHPMEGKAECNHHEKQLHRKQETEKEEETEDKEQTRQVCHYY